MLTKKAAYLKTAQGFELKWRQRDKTIAFIIAAIGTVFGLLSLIAIIILLPLKQTNTELYVADKLAGTVEKVTTAEKGELSENSALARYFTQQYVRLREGYDYFRLQHDYDTVQRYGNKVVNKAYLDWWNSSSAPDKVFKDAEYTAEITFITNFISASSNPDNPDLLSTLRFRKDIRDVLSGNVQPEYWTVRMTWRFEPPQAMTDAQRANNPLGFVVTSYQREKEQGNSHENRGIAFPCRTGAGFRRCAGCHHSAREQR